MLLRISQCWSLYKAIAATTNHLVFKIAHKLFIAINLQVRISYATKQIIISVEN